jgi:hypothetical protein
MKRIFIKKCFLLMVGNVCYVKQFTNVLRNMIKRFTNNKVIEKEVQKWLRQWKDFYAVGFDALIKRWVKYINVGGEYVEK